MKRLSGALVLLASAGGCMTTDSGAPAGSGVYMSKAFGNADSAQGIHNGPYSAVAANSMVGPYGQPVAMTAPAAYQEPTGADLARAVVSRSLPPEVLQQVKFDGSTGPGAMPPIPGALPPGMVPPPGSGPPGGQLMPPGAGLPLNNSAAFPPPGYGGGTMVPNAVAAVGALTGCAPAPFAVQRTSVKFLGNMEKVSWYSPTTDGKPAANELFPPVTYNFLQAAIYRLKLSDFPGRPNVILYPTLEVVPANAKTATFLAHSAVPVSITEDDLDQVQAGNFVVKVIYLPDPNFQDLAATGPDEVVSSRLEPGVNPIEEAHRRGQILLVVRLGNINLEAPNTPAMNAPPPQPPAVSQAPAMGMPPAMAGRMVPFGGMMGRPGMPGAGLPGLQPPPSMLPPAMPPTSGPAAAAPTGDQPTGPGIPIGAAPRTGAVIQTSYSPNSPAR